MIRYRLTVRTHSSAIHYRPEEERRGHPSFLRRLEVVAPDPDEAVHAAPAAVILSCVGERLERVLSCAPVEDLDDLRLVPWRRP